MSDLKHNKICTKLDEELSEYNTLHDRINFILETFETFGAIDEIKKVNIKNKTIVVIIDNHHVTMQINNKELEESCSDTDDYCDHMDMRIWKYILYEFNHNSKHNKKTHKSDNSEITDAIINSESLVSIIDDKHDMCPKTYELMYYMYKSMKLDDENHSYHEKIQESKSIFDLLVSLNITDVQPKNYSILKRLYDMAKE